MNKCIENKSSAHGVGRQEQVITIDELPGYRFLSNIIGNQCDLGILVCSLDQTFRNLHFKSALSRICRSCTHDSRKVGFLDCIAVDKDETADSQAC